MRNINLEKTGDAAIVNYGNTCRLKELMKRAEAGEHLVLGFLGGSITQGSLATEPEKCYAALVYQWWVQKFPQASFEYVNAGVGGTTSHYAAARVQSHLLNRKPDFVIVEFSVNDEATEHFQETYESVIRKVYGASNMPAVLILSNVFYNDGHSAQEQHVEVGKYYKIPCISIKDSIYQEILSGNIMACEISPDNLHPNDAGHSLVCGMVTHFLEKIYEKRCEKEPEAEMPEVSMTRNHYETVRRYQNFNCNPYISGFYADSRVPEAVWDNFACGWISRKPGASVRFQVTGTEIAVQYRKTIHKPAPIAIAVLDGDEKHAVVLDANFEETWGDCLYLQELAENLPGMEHTVEVKITKIPEECVSDFYLVSVITGC